MRGCAPGTVRPVLRLSDADEEQIETLLRLTERYCVVGQTLHRSPNVTFER
jgi:uncharacterized OsmC-like protein